MRWTSDGSQTTIRMKPTPFGFYLDEGDAHDTPQKTRTSRSPNGGYHYFLHLIGGSHGASATCPATRWISKRSTAAVWRYAGRLHRDAVQCGGSRYQSPARQDSAALRRQHRGLASSVDSPSPDEDERPNLLPARGDEEEWPTAACPPSRRQYRSQDLFGPISHSDDGKLLSPYGHSRLTKVRRRPQPAPSASFTVLCASGGARKPSARGQPDGLRGPERATTLFGQADPEPIQPATVAACRQTWRETRHESVAHRSAGLQPRRPSKCTGRRSLSNADLLRRIRSRSPCILGHSEYRPEPCIASRSRRSPIDADRRV